MEPLLKGKNVLITGGVSGIGRTIVELFLSEGANVYFTNIVETEPEASLQTLAKQHGSTLRCLLLDVAKEEDCIRVVEQTTKEAGSIDVLVNNAGIAKDGLIIGMKAKDWFDVLNINLTGAFFMSRETVRTMIRKRAGSIINITSVVGQVGNPGQANYCSSKAGIVGLTKSLAREVAARGVRVNAVAPGFIETAMTAALGEDQQDALKKQIPLARMGSSLDVAKTALFLASDLSSYITGATIDVNGGMSMR